MPIADAPLSGRMLGRFLLHEVIGSGGFGTVYRCEQPRLERQAVIKVLHERCSSNDVAQSRFTQEARLASRLDHHYATHVYDAGAEQDGVLWIAMEYVAGITLEEWLVKNGPMPPAVLIPFLEKLAEVVYAAHKLGIVHRDLKPSNVMVVESDHGPIPKLLDLGIAKVVHDLAPVQPAEWADGSFGENHEISGRLLTRSGAGMGSAPYMSPEQWRSPAAVGAASDIYSFGIIGYRALTGRLPFRATTMEGYRELHCHSDMPTLADGLAKEFEQVLRRAVSKYPEARYGTVKELGAALREVWETSEREQLRVAAKQWQVGLRAQGLLWGEDMLERFERWTSHASWPSLSDTETDFIAHSRRLARRTLWTRRSLVTLALLFIVAAVSVKMYLALQRADFAERLIAQGEVDRGRQSLRDDPADARAHLLEGYRRGERSPSVKFMLARALQPHLAEQARLPSVGGRMWSAAYAPDGKTFVTTDDIGAQVWDARGYEHLFSVGHNDTVFDAVYSRDGSAIFTASGDGTVGMWDATSGHLLRKLTGPGLRKPRYDLLASSPDGTFIAAIDVSGKVVQVWDARSGAPVAELPADGAEFPALAFSSDGRSLLATGGVEVGVFNTKTWARVLTIPHVRRMALDPTGSRLVTGSATGDTSILDIVTGVRIKHLRETGEPIDRVVFSANGALIATATSDGGVQIWNVADGSLRSQIGARRGKVLAMEFDRSSRRLLCAGADGSVAVVDVSLGTIVAVLDGPQGIVRVAHFDAEAHRILAASWDGTARVWSADAPYLRWSAAAVGDDCWRGTERDSRFAVVACNGRTEVWDTARDHLVVELPSADVSGGSAPSVAPVITADGGQVAIVHGQTVELYGIPSGRLVGVVSHGATVTAVAFSPFGNDLVSGDQAGIVLVTHDAKELAALPSSGCPIDAVGFLPGGRVMSADEEKRIRIYAPRTWELLGELSAPTRIGSLLPSSDGFRLITLPNAHISSNIGRPVAPSLWDLLRYRLVATLDGHSGQIFSARFVSSDAQILTAGSEGTARLWDGSTGRHLQTYRGSFRFLADATLTPDGDAVVAAGGDGVIRFWERESGRFLWQMPAYRSPVVGIHWVGADLVTRGLHGEMSRWAFADAEEIIEEGIRLALSCADEEAQPPEACTSP